jgi:hypothetical protein
MVKNRAFFLLLFVVLSALQLNAQSTSETVVLLQGKTLDTQGRHISVQLTFTDKQNNKKVRTKSNKSSGLYQVVLKPEHEYSVDFKGFISADSTNSVTVPVVTKYTEISQTFTLKKIRQGLELCRFNAFKPKDTVLTCDYKEYFNRMKQFLRENINASVVITVSMKDSYFKKKRVKKYYKDKRGRKRYKRVWLKPKEQLQKVLDARMLAVRNYVDSLKIRSSMLSFKTDDTMGPKPKKKKKKRRRRHKKKKKKANEPPPPPPVDNIIITVGKMMKI